MRKAFSLVMAMSLTAGSTFGPHVVMAAETNRSIELAGNITLQIVFEVPESLDNDIEVTLNSDSGINGTEPIGTMKLSEEEGTIDNKYEYELTYIYTDETQKLISSVEVKVKNLPQGVYSFELSSDRYTNFTTSNINLFENHLKVVVQTNANGFMLGDVDGNGLVNEYDLNEVIKNLAQDLPYDNVGVDLNGDGKVDIFDLAISNRALNAEEDSIGQELYSLGVFEEIMLANIVDGSLVVSDNIVVEGDLEDLFNGDTEVTLRSENGSITETNSAEISMEFETEIETTVIDLDIPEQFIGVQGETIVTYIDEYGVERTMTVDFSRSPMARSTENETVVINLGTKVAVKKVTIKVTAVVDEAGNTDYLTVSEVSFIQDIVPDELDMEQSKVLNLKATPQNASVDLTWSRSVNITGYNVYVSDTYSDDIADYSLLAKVNTESYTAAMCDGQKMTNGETYYFIVTSTSGSWESVPSEVVSATPMATEVPSQVDNLSLRAGDTLINVSYTAAKNADSYNVYYKEEDDTTYKKANSSPIEGTSYVLSGLTNDVTYDVYVRAENIIGEGPASNIYQATPYEDVIEDPGVPKTNMIDNSNIKSARLINANNVGNHYGEEGFDISYVYDGDYETHWTANQWWLSGVVEFELYDAYEMDYLVWVPRLDGIYSNSMGAHWQGNGSYTIAIWEEGDDLNGDPTYTKTGLATKKTNEQGKSFYILPFDKSNVQKIQVANGIYAGAPTVTSLSEIHFYEYDSLTDDIADLFTDTTFTEVKSTVTQSDIDALRDRLGDESSYFVNHTTLSHEISLAESLMNGETDALGVVHDGVLSTRGFQPLGFTGKSGETLTIYADIPEGETITVTPTKFYAEVTAWQGSPITLVSGRNEITIPAITSGSGGVLYFTYNGSQGDDIKLHAIHHTDNTTFSTVAIKEMPVLELLNWFDMTEAERRSVIEEYITNLEAYVAQIKTMNTAATINYYNATEVSMPYALLSMPGDQILSGIESGLSTMDQKVDRVYENTLAWIQFMELMFTTYGVDEENFMSQTRQNIRYMQMFSGAFMYAAGSHVGIEYTECSPLIRGTRNSNTFGWGIAHEVGHNLDTMGYVEVTNNIYSLFAQVWDDDIQGGDSRVPFDDVFERVSTISVGASNNVFVELGMYWQLRLAYDDEYETQTDNFFYNFNKMYRAGAYSSYTKDERIAIIASEVAGKNLADFFMSWGKELSAEAISAMSEFGTETRLVQYLSDESRRLRLDSSYTDITSLSGVSATSEYKAFEDTNGGVVAISLNGLSNTAKEKLQGFVVYKNGESVGFMHASDAYFEDQIGSANNLSYEYELVPVTKLGMQLSTIDAGQVKVSYDLVVSRDNWDATIAENGDIHIKFNEVTTSSGIRLEPYNNYKNDDISIYIPQGTSQIVERTTTGAIMSISDVPSDYSLIEALDFGNNDTTDDGKYIAYFNKPGAPESDKRIWAYDLDQVVISGVSDPESFIKDLDFIQYAGDNIEFYDPTMGILGKDYVFDPEAGEDGKIKAGTVVIVGTYRGDPVYNTVFMKGRYLKIDHTMGTEEEVERYINGESILFVEIPDDGEVSNTSDGFFVFIPDIQAESELMHDHDDDEDCTGVHVDSLFPVYVKAELKRSDDPYYASANDRTTSTTSWVMTQSYATLPTIILEGDDQ
ncbi:MAG: hypothetical protein ATN35_05945 [Epulopiscium sp. Nele67-Bin004]|nr:MAG: hypothetical protein ATN35_05945 [Epulopiscium sp. Nele67-Bin004]